MNPGGFAGMNQKVLSQCRARHRTGKGHGGCCCPVRTHRCLPWLCWGGKGAHLGSPGDPACLGGRVQLLPVHPSRLASLQGKKQGGKDSPEPQRETRTLRGDGGGGTSVAGGGRISPEEDFCPARCGYGHPPPTFRSYVANLPSSTQDAGDASRSHGSMRTLLTGWSRGTGGSGGSHGTHSTQGSSLGTDRHLCQLLCRAEKGRCGMGRGGSRPAGGALLGPSPCSIFRTTSTMCWSPASRPCQRGEEGHTVKGDCSFCPHLHPQSRSHPDPPVQSTSLHPVLPSHPSLFSIWSQYKCSSLGSRRARPHCNLLTVLIFCSGIFQA